MARLRGRPKKSPGSNPRRRAKKQNIWLEANGYLFEKVTLVKKIFVVGMVAFWVLMTNHCGLEMIPSLKFLACSPENDAAQHLPNDCGEKGDACATVESGLYKSEEKQISADKAPLSTVLVLPLLSDLVPIESLGPLLPMEDARPELPHAWQFSFRAALPPRAPSLLS